VESKSYTALQRRERDLARRGTALELDELGALLGGRVGEEEVGEHARAEAPVLVDDREHGLASRRRGEVDAAGVRAVEHESVDAVGMPARVQRRDAGARRGTEERDPAGAGLVDERLERRELLVEGARRAWRRGRRRRRRARSYRMTVRCGPSAPVNRRNLALRQSSSRWLDHQPPMTSGGPCPTADHAMDAPSRSRSG
jgi:hypothetical protein